MMLDMGTSERAYDRGGRRGERALASFATDVLDARTRAAISQATLGAAVRMSQPKIHRVEAGKLRSLSIIDASRIASALGLDLSVKAYPGGPAIRDAAQTERLKRLLTNVAQPLRYRVEVPLPDREGLRDQRAFDAMLYGHGQTTAIELETRLYDIQAQLRQIMLKWRDGQPDNLLLVVANTRHNRRVLEEHRELFVDLPRQRTAAVLRSLRAGRHPSTGLILF
jgi:transcriptional regulator with XRE-family HTH domain